MAGLIMALLILVPLGTGLGILLAWGRPVVQASLALAMSLGVLGLSIALMGLGNGTVGYSVGAWPAPYGIELRADGLSRLMLLLTGLITSTAMAYHLGRTLEGAPLASNPFYQLTFPLLLLSLVGLFLTADFFNFYVFFELLAVSSYLLVSLGKKAPLEAAWKYAAQSVVGSLSLLAGVCLIYGETGTLAMGGVGAQITGPALWAAPFLLTAFLLKGAIFPFHFWQPDAHAAATTPGSMLLAGLLINVGLYGLLRFWPLLMGDELRWLFVWVGAASLAFGAVAAWRQQDAKRLLGYSSISQLGYVLVGLGWGTVGAVGAAIYYMIAHALGKALLFLVTGLLSDRLGDTRFQAMAGSGVRRPWLAAAYLVGALSLAGLPPTMGFMGKVGLLSEGLAVEAYAWAGWAALGSLLTLAYAARAYRLLFWGPPAAEGPGAAPPHPLARAALAVLGLGVVVAGLWAQPLYAYCLASAEALDPRPAAAARRAP